jgi:heme/copper-type cytochrome/quinol oxidase subunit 1
MTSTYTDLSGTGVAGTDLAGDDTAVSVVPAHQPPRTALERAMAGADHKTTGRLYIGASLVFGVIGLAATIAYQMAGVDDRWSSSSVDAAFQLFTGGRLLLVLGFIVPLFVGLAVLVVPLQVGAATIAFPRAAALSFWAWFLATVMLCASYATNGGIAGGNKDAQVLALTSVGLMVLALLLASVCIITTAVALRAPGMYLDRVPLFTWASFVAASVWMLTLPVWLVNVVLIFIDVRYGRPGEIGAVDAQWTQLAWIFSPPQVFAFVIPVLGILGDGVATMSGVRLRGRGWVMGAIGAFGTLCIGAAVQPALIADPYGIPAIQVQIIALLVPLCIVGAAASVTLAAGRRSGGPELAGIAAWVVLILASASAIVLFAGFSLTVSPEAVALPAKALAAPAAAPLFTWGILGLVLTVAVLGAIGGLALWSSKITGRSLRRSGVSVLVGMTVLGGLASALPLFVLAFANRSPELGDSRQALLGVSAVGLGVLAVTLIALGLMLLARPGGDQPGPADPWGTGQSLEWLADSPPPPANFSDLPGSSALPEVRSAEPLLDLAEAADRGE